MKELNVKHKVKYEKDGLIIICELDQQALAALILHDDVLLISVNEQRVAAIKRKRKTAS